MFSKQKAIAAGLLLYTLCHCSQESQAPSTRSREEKLGGEEKILNPAEPTTVAAAKSSNASENSRQELEDKEQAVTFSGNRLDNEESQEELQRKEEKKAQTCSERDLIKEIEFIVDTTGLNPLVVNSAYTQNKAVMEKAQEVIKLKADEKAKGAAPQILKGELSDGSEKIIIYQRSLTSAPPQPLFSVSLSATSASKPLIFDVDENTNPLFAGSYYRQKFKVSSSDKISELRRLTIAKKEIELLASNLMESNFATASGVPMIQLEEVNRRLIENLKIKINGELVYERLDIRHAFSKNSADGTEQNEEEAALSFGREWSELDLKKNPTFKKYVEALTACHNPSP